MMKNISFEVKPGSQVTCLVEYPNECPVCHHLINSGYVAHTFIQSKKELQVVFRCTNEQC